MFPLNNGKSGRPIFSSAGAGRSCALSMMVANCSPVLDKNLAPMGPGIFANTGAEVWRKAPGALSDSNSVLDEFQSAKKCCLSCQAAKHVDS